MCFGLSIIKGLFLLIMMDIITVEERMVSLLKRVFLFIVTRISVIRNYFGSETGIPVINREFMYTEDHDL